MPKRQNEFRFLNDILLFCFFCPGYSVILITFQSEMKIWLSKNSEVSLREQLTRQIMAAISSGDLQSGDKLPSVRELALRFKIHQNTVSIAYQWLEENKWVESRQGSGVFVCKLAKEKRETAGFEAENELDALISQFFRQTQRLGFTNSQIESSFRKFLITPKPEHILIVENDEYLRRIIFTELHSAINFPVFAISLEELINSSLSNNSIIVALPETAEKLREVFSNTTIVSLKINSAQVGIQGQQRPQADKLIGIVSGWEMFLRWSKTFLIAVGIEMESILVRDAREKHFDKGLDSCVFVITDSATAQILPKSLSKRIFYLIADDSIEELKSLIS